MDLPSLPFQIETFVEGIEFTGSPRSYTWVLYHANCDDGFGAAFVHWLWSREEKAPLATIYCPVQYNKPLPKELLEDERYNKPYRIYVLDFSFPPEVLDSLALISRPLYYNILLDHHKTAVEQLENYKNPSWDIRINKDNSKSGAILAWEFFFGRDSITPVFISYLDDRDRWQFKLDRSKEFTANLRSYPRDFQVWKEIHNRIENSLVDGLGFFLSEGEAQLRLFSQYLQSNLKRAVIGKGGIPIVNCSPEYSSDLGHLLCESFGSDYSLCYNTDGQKAYCSLRSESGFDVSVVAQKYGGGGHKPAAGFSMPIEKFFKEFFVETKEEKSNEPV